MKRTAPTLHRARLPHPRLSLCPSSPSTDDPDRSHRFPPYPIPANDSLCSSALLPPSFYYDFFVPEGTDPLTDKDLKKIRQQMLKIIKWNLPVVEEEVTRGEAQRRIEELAEPFKLELLDSIPDGPPITLWHLGDPPPADTVFDETPDKVTQGGRRVGGKPLRHWWDLCAGPHLESTGELVGKGIALECKRSVQYCAVGVAGVAYWRRLSVKSEEAYVLSVCVLSVCVFLVPFFLPH